MRGTLNIEGREYPGLLKLIPNPPKILYFKGDLREGIFSNCLAVIGSRKMSPYGIKVVDHILSSLSKETTIVSGFMYGVDAQAHRKAIDLKLATIAVMPCGIDCVHPSDQKDLYEEIISSGGLVISEYPEDFPPRNWTYAKRNRIVAGLSKAILVIEAALGSGSLITAELGNKYGRKVLAVPGNIFSDVSKGCLQILQKYASMVVSGGQINEILGFHQGELIKELAQEDARDNILDLLNAGPLTLDDISIALRVSITTLSIRVTQLCVKGEIIERGGKFYAR